MSICKRNSNGILADSGESFGSSLTYTYKQPNILPDKEYAKVRCLWIGNDMTPIRGYPSCLFADKASMPCLRAVAPRHPLSKAPA